MIAQKGNYGYIDAHKKGQLRKTLVFFLLPLAIFGVGYVSTGGIDNLLTVVAVVGSLPACKELVNVILFFKKSSIPKEMYEEIHSHSEGLTELYELEITTYERNFPIVAAVVAGKEFVGYGVSPKLEEKLAATHIKGILKNNGYQQNVHIFKNLKQYLERVDALREKSNQVETEEPFVDEKYPGMTREEIVKAIVIAISI